MKRASALLVCRLAGRPIGAMAAAPAAADATTSRPLAALLTELLVADLDRRDAAYREAAKLGPAQLAIVVQRLDHTLRRTNRGYRPGPRRLRDPGLAKIGDASQP